MKFYNTISNSVKHSVSILFIAFSAIGIHAQNASNSPYSRFGIGELQTTQNPRNTALGGMSVGLIGLHNVSNWNPASYLNLDSMSVLFNVSFQMTPSTLSEKQANSEVVSANTNSASLGEVSLAFPITSWLKSSFGLVPSSRMSYSVVRNFSGDTNIGKSRLEHNGQGGLNQVFLGFALGTNRIVVGANINYQFGQFERAAELTFPDTVLRYPVITNLTKRLEARGVFFDFGLQYKQPLAKRYQLGIGVTYSPSYTLKASQDLGGYAVISTAVRDSIFFDVPEDGTLTMPDRYTIGLSFEKINRWVIGVEYAKINFKNYKEFSKTDPYFSNTYTFRAGLELKGQYMDNQFLNRLSYRAGYHLGTNYLVFENTQIKQYGISFGLGMPIRRTPSKLDIAVEIGRRGHINNGQIQENYGRIVIGISAFDRWFMRGKFD